jgi:hypothetical protein
MATQVLAQASLFAIRRDNPVQILEINRLRSLFPDVRIPRFPTGGGPFSQIICSIKADSRM